MTRETLVAIFKDGVSEQTLPDRPLQLSYTCSFTSGSAEDNTVGLVALLRSVSGMPILNYKLKYFQILCSFCIEIAYLNALGIVKVFFQEQNIWVRDKQAICWWNLSSLRNTFSLAAVIIPSITGCIVRNFRKAKILTQVHLARDIPVIQFSCD